MLADAARFLQQTLPQQGASGPEQAHAPTAVPIPSGPPPPNPKAAAQATVQGTPVTLASLSAQLDSLRAMVGNPEVRTCAVDDLHLASASLDDLLRERISLRESVERYEAKVCEACPTLPTVSTALLDSGATHAVIPYNPQLNNLERVPVTLAGDSREEWWRTQGGTLVVPPMSGQGTNEPKGQTILPLGALVEQLGCRVTWSKRQGLKVTHPSLGVLRTGVSSNTCPYLQEGQALQLIAELEANRLDGLREQVDTLECRLREVMNPLNPTEAL